MNILIVDPFQTGHHLSYLYHISEAFLNNAVKVFSAGNINDEYIGSFERLKELYPDRFDFTVIRDEYGGYCNRTSPEYIEIIKQRWLAINELVESHNSKFDFVFLPWLDSYIEGRVESGFYDRLAFVWAGIYFQPYFLDPRITSIDKCRFIDPAPLFSHKSCIALCTLVDTDEVKAHFLFRDKPFFAIPDFTDTGVAEICDFQKEIEFKRDDRFTIGLFGSLAKRKGIIELFHTIVRYKLYEHCFFIIAGELIQSDFSQDEKNFITSVLKDHHASFFYHPRRLESEAEFNYLMTQCDLIYSAYRHFYYSSNMLIKAASLNKPVIATSGTYMGDEVEKYELGLSVELKPKSIFDAITKISENPGKFSSSEKTRHYQQKHSLGKLNYVIEEVIDYAENKLNLSAER